MRAFRSTVHLSKLRCVRGMLALAFAAAAVGYPDIAIASGQGSLEAEEKVTSLVKEPASARADLRLETDSIDLGIKGAYRLDGLSVKFFSAVERGAEGQSATAWFWIDGAAEIVASTVDYEKGLLHLGDMTVRTDAVIDAAQTEALQRLSKGELGVALAQIPLSIGCARAKHGLELATAALLLPWQLILSATENRDFEEQLATAACDLSDFRQSNRIKINKESKTIGVPFVLTEWLLESRPLVALKSGGVNYCSMYTDCHSLTGYDNPCFSCCGNGCANGNVCVTHPACVIHDSCYEAAGGWSFGCDWDCVFTWGASFCAGLALGNCDWSSSGPGQFCDIQLMPGSNHHTYGWEICTGGGCSQAHGSSSSGGGGNSSNGGGCSDPSFACCVENCSVGAWSCLNDCETQFPAGE